MTNVDVASAILDFLGAAKGRSMKEICESFRDIPTTHLLMVLNFMRDYDFISWKDDKIQLVASVSKFVKKIRVEETV